MLQQLLLNGIIAGSIYALIAIGFTVIYRTVKFFHFAHGVVYTAAAYFAYSIVQCLGVGEFWSLEVAIIIAVVGAGVLGVLIDRLVYLPLRKKQANNLIFLLASFGVFIFLQNFIQLLYGAQILTIRTGPVVEGHHIFSAVITSIQILLLVVSLGVLVLLWIFIRWTRMGKALRAVADDSMAANVVGINPERIIMYSFL